jgi:pimeloyl-ACP methyl ester carboxylesterase
MDPSAAPTPTHHHNADADVDVDVHVDVDEDAPPRKPWFRWVPTTTKHREYYEARVLESMPLPYKVQQVTVNIPTAAESHRRESAEHHINTLTILDDETHTPDGKPKPNLLLLHGMGAGLGIWTLNMHELRKHYTVHAIDIIGFGGSSRPFFKSDDYDHIEKIFAESIDSWRQQMGIDRFHLLGHSFGGYIAGIYALRHPENLDHVIFADAWGFNEKSPDFDEWVQKQSIVKRALFGVVKKMPPLAVLRLTGPWGPKMIRMRRDIGAKVEGVMDKEHLFDYIFHSNAQRPSAELAFKKLCEDMPFAARPMLPRVHSLDEDLPVTFLHGDRSWTEKVGIKAAEMRPRNTRVRFLSNAGHHIMWDNPPEFNEFVAEVSNIKKQPLQRTSSKSNSKKNVQGTHFESSVIV